jgi:hypothetical protein
LDQLTALRLQALGAVNGMVVYVPPAHTREKDLDSIDPNSEPNLLSADVVWGLVTTHLSESSWRELLMGQQTGKQVVVLADAAFVPKLESALPGCVFSINPGDPGETERAIVDFLKQTDFEEEGKRMLIALGTLALGLLLFAPQD